MLLRAPFLRPVLLGAGVLSLLATGMVAAATPTLEIRFDGHQFQPAILPVPARSPLVVKVVNAGRETIEFESFRLNREVTVTPGETVEVRLPALSPGRYDFYDDFHDSVPKGYLIAK